MVLAGHCVCATTHIAGAEEDGQAAQEDQPLLLHRCSRDGPAGWLLCVLCV